MDGGDEWRPAGGRMGGRPAVGALEPPTWLELRCPEKPHSAADGVQNRGSKFVYSVYLHLIYRIGIYRYKRNHSRTAVNHSDPLRGHLGTPLGEQQGWGLAAEWAS